MRRKNNLFKGTFMDIFKLMADALINFFIPLRRTEAITWKNFVLAVQKRDPIFPG